MSIKKVIKWISAVLVMGFIAYIGVLIFMGYNSFGSSIATKGAVQPVVDPGLPTGYMVVSCLEAQGLRKDIDFRIVPDPYKRGTGKIQWNWGNISQNPQAGDEPAIRACAR